MQNRRRIIQLFPLHPSEDQSVYVIKPASTEDEKCNDPSEIDQEHPIGISGWQENLSLIEAEMLSKALAQAVSLSRQVGWTGNELPESNHAFGES